MTETTNHRRGLPTMIDVAERAGVSLKTVSRVVNGESGASQRTRTIVRQAIDDLGYQRNTAASELRSGRSGLIGLVLEDVSEPFQSELARAIEWELSKEGLILLTVSTGGDVGRARRAELALVERRADGLIVFPSVQHNPDLAALVELGTKLVFVDRPTDGIATDSVRSAHRQGAHDATCRLIDQGHTRIAYLGDPTTLYTGAERFAGYVEALLGHSLQFDPELVHLQNPDDQGVGDAFRQMTRLDSPPTALFTGNSLTTISLLRSPTFEPATIAHVAFDDLVLGDLLKVPLTVISQNISEIGRTAARLLLERLAGDTSDPKTVIIPTRLNVRESDWPLSALAPRPRQPEQPLELGRTLAPEPG